MRLREPLLLTLVLWGGMHEPAPRSAYTYEER
jgi:hypothetical protein